MILKKLKLNNIRSYRDPIQIDFTTGISLFEGDVGSGKSSLFIATEFALFGLGDIDGRHLLRISEKEGSVELEFEAKGETYKVGRKLVRRRNKVSQRDCYIMEGGVKTEYNVTDTKKRILQILDFKEPPDPRSRSVIYRYAIYTPQEMMRDVIRQKPDRRKETLRKAFGIEEYRRASENAGTISNWMSGEIRALESSETELERAKEELKIEQERLKKAEEALEKAKDLLNTIKSDKEKITKRIKEKEIEESELRALDSSIAVIKTKISQTEKAIGNLKERISTIEEQISLAESARKELEILLPEHKHYEKLKKELPDLEKKNEEYRKKGNDKKLVEQNIENKRKNLREQLEKMKIRIAEIIKKIEDLKEQLKKIGSLKEKANELERETSPIDGLMEDSTEGKKRIERVKQQLENIRKDKTAKQREWTRIETVGVDAKCPRCQQVLTPEHYKALKEKYEEEINALETSIKKIQESIKEKKKFNQELDDKIKKLKEKKNNLNDIKMEIVRLQSQEQALESQQDETIKIQEEIDELNELLKDDAFAEELLKEIEGLGKALEALTPLVERYNKVRNEVKKLDELKVEARYIEAKSEADRITELHTERKKIDSEFKKAVKNIENFEDELKEKNREYEDKKPVLLELEKLRESDKKMAEKEGELKGEISGISKESKIAEERIENLNKGIESYEVDLRQAETYRQLRIWLNQFFIPSIASIEKSVLLNINHDFDKLFRKWFEELVESGELTGAINEDFTPIITQGGYELDVESLSGGEKTSIALAYRLALNTMVKKLSEITESNLLILDEPTDGFSREQLNKLRDILNDLNCEQIIIISHERELEGMADNIYRVVKEGGISTAHADLRARAVIKQQ